MTKKTRTDYVARVKKGITLYAAMAAIKNNEDLYIKYGERGPFRIRAHEFEHTDHINRSYTISDGNLFGRSMNIESDKSGKSFLYCYTFDLFNNKTTARLYFEHIEIVEKPEEDE